MPPELDSVGAEVSPCALLPSSLPTQSLSTMKGSNAGWRNEQGSDGRIALGVTQPPTQAAACLLCRSSVQGWLRVYTG